MFNGSFSFINYEFKENLFGCKTILSYANTIHIGTCKCFYLDSRLDRNSLFPIN